MLYTENISQGLLWRYESLQERAKVCILSEIQCMSSNFARELFTDVFIFQACESENTLMSYLPFTSFLSFYTVSSRGGNMFQMYISKFSLVYPFILQGNIWKWYHWGVTYREQSSVDFSGHRQFISSICLYVFCLGIFCASTFLTSLSFHEIFSFFTVRVGRDGTEGKIQWGILPIFWYSHLFPVKWYDCPLWLSLWLGWAVFLVLPDELGVKVKRVTSGLVYFVLMQDL